jgi:hypothetical protein
MPIDGRLMSRFDLLYFLDHIYFFYMGCEFPKSRCYFLGHLNIRKFNKLCYIFCRFNDGAYIGRSANSVSLKI